MSSRPVLPLIVAFALSLALHGGLLLPDVLRPAAAPPRPALRAELRLPPLPEERSVAPPAESLLKNTLDVEAAEPARAAALPPPPEKPGATARARAETKREVRSAQKKLAQHLYYPPEAVARGLEGEVRLRVTLAADGSVADVRVAASSGHPLLDHAAEKAAWAMGRADASGRELILPVVFRLQ